jgi:hypothetical protein
MKVKIFKGWNSILLQNEIDEFLNYVSNRIVHITQSQSGECITISIFYNEK